MDLQVLYENSTGTNTFIVNGDTVQIMQNDHFENINLENGHILSMGRYSPGAGTTYMLKGDISYFRFNDEEFLFEDFGSDTLLGSEGTVLDILGDVEWRKDTLGFTLSEFHYCDTIELNDIHVTSFTRSGASLYLDLSNGQTFAVRDSFLTEQEIQDMVDVNRSWLLKDGGVPDNATDTVYRDGVAVIEGSRWNKTISSNSLDLRSTSPIWLPSFFLQAFVEDEINPIITDQIYSTPFSSERILSVSKRDFSESTSIWLDSRSGVRFLPYGTGQYEATPTYLLGVDASGLIKEVRPTSGIDTIIHLGDSVFFDFDDKTFTIRDSVRSDAEIITLIEANRIFQQLGRSGDFITLSEGGGQVLDLHLKDAIHTGDSVKLVLSDGRNITFRDSSLSVDAVRDMILEEIPETVFYVKQGSVTAPVNWGDVVELENGTVNVNMPTKVKMIDSLNALEVCIWQVVKVIESDTTYRNYIEFNGTNSSYGYRAESSTRVPIELPFSFRFSFNDLTDVEQAILSNGGEVGNNQFAFRLNANGDFWFRNGGRNVAFPISDLQEGYVHEIEVRQVDDDVGVFLDGVLKGTMSSIASGMGVTHIARQSSNNRPFNGRLYEIKSPGGGLPIDEGSGDKLFGPGGIEYDINNATWGVDTVIQVVEVFDTLFQCDTIYLTDRFVSDATF